MYASLRYVEWRLKSVAWAERLYFFHCCFYAILVTISNVNVILIKGMTEVIFNSGIRRRENQMSYMNSIHKYWFT